MRVLMKMPAYVNALPGGDEAAMDCFRSFDDAYNENASDGEAYLHQPDETEGAAAALGFVDGRSDPDAILHEAGLWNRRIANDFDAVLKQFLSSVPEHGRDGPAAWLTVPSPTAYALQKAVTALNGQAHDFADYALLVNGYGYPTSLFEPDQLDAIRAAPENYAILEVQPK